MPTGKIGTPATAAELNGGSAAYAPGDTYLGATAADPYNYYNYQFVCRDHWYDPDKYTINVRVTDEDSEAGNPTLDNYYTWKEWP